MDKCMISSEVTGTQDFVDMAIESQYLYFRMCLNSNSTGMVDGVPLLARMFGVDRNSIDELAENGFILPGRIKGRYWITHWFNMNTIEKMGAPADLNDFLNIERRRAELSASTAPVKYYRDKLLKDGLIKSVPDYSTICSEVDDQSTTSRRVVYDQSMSSRRPVDGRGEERSGEETSRSRSEAREENDDDDGGVGVFKNVHLTADEMKVVRDTLGEYADVYIDIVSNVRHDNPGSAKYNDASTIMKWYDEDKAKGKLPHLDKNGSFDTEEAFSLSLAHNGTSYGKEYSKTTSPSNESRSNRINDATGHTADTMAAAEAMGLTSDDDFPF